MGSATAYFLGVTRRRSWVGHGFLRGSLFAGGGIKPEDVAIARGYALEARAGRLISPRHGVRSAPLPELTPSRGCRSSRVSPCTREHSRSEMLIGSTAGRFGESGHAEYAASKSAMLGLLRSLKKHSSGAFSIGPTPPVPDAVRLVSGEAGQGATAIAIAAAGVSDEGGMLFYVEIEPGPASPAPSSPPSAADGKMLGELLKKLGCSTRILLARPLSVALGGDTDLAGNAIRPPAIAGAVRLLRAEAAGAKRVFEDTPVVPLDVWYPLQAKRIRYFKKAPGAETPAADENN